MISVMYADDEEGLLEPGKLFLEKSGQCSADSVASATKVLQKTESTSYDAIVSDYEIPGIEGIAFLKIIRAEFPDIPFIIFTNKASEDVVIKAFDNGADVFVVQVFDITDHKEKGESLKQSEHRFSDIISCLPDATRVINPNCKVIAGNKAIDEITGVKA